VLLPVTYTSIRTVKLIVLFLGSYPLAALLKRVPDNQPNLKNIFNIAYVSISPRRNELSY
jgi:hypothetical protein